MSVKSKSGKISVSLPLSDFVKEHKSLVKILESGIKNKIIRESKNQQKELVNILKSVKKLKQKKIKK